MPLLDRRSLTTNCRLNRGDIYFFHRHHGIERPLGCGVIGAGIRLDQHDRGDLPRDTPFVFAPAAFALLAPVANDRIPIPIGSA